jgi:phosphoribosylformylglycinamidine cyclo-ligase
MYAPKHFDLAGFIVGVLERDNMLGAHRVKSGDVLLGLSSSGLHANGYSLVRKIMFEQLKLKANDVLWETERSVCTVADELLIPTKLYVKPTKILLEDGIDVHGIAHITGGGLLENIPRIIPLPLKASLDLRNRTIPRIFSYLMEHGPISTEEMLRTFNMGIGLVIALPTAHVERALALLEAWGDPGFIIGHVMEGDGGSRCFVKI